MQPWGATCTESELRFTARLAHEVDGPTDLRLELLPFTRPRSYAQHARQEQYVFAYCRFALAAVVAVVLFSCGP